MLSPLDDYPVHQIPEPIRFVGPSDRNFYDRRYFDLHDCSDELMLVTGMGRYPNLGVTDAFAVVIRNGVHDVVRASRELGAERMNTSVGPLRIEVLEGLRRLRVICEPNAWGLAFDLTWDGHVPAHLEERHFIRQLGRPDHTLNFRSGMRMVESATLHFTQPDGRRLDVALTPLLPLHAGVGTGYGFDADWRHGMYQGPLKVEGLMLDLAKPEDRARIFGLVDSAARFECESEGEGGYGLFEYLVLGAYAKYGFEDFLDGAP